MGENMRKNYTTLITMVTLSVTCIYMTWMNRQNCKQNQLLRRIVDKDYLTGLWTRNVLERDIELAIKNKNRFALYMIDLDDFKMINDTLTHDGGDMVLCHVAQCLKRLEDDIVKVYRYAGDEFMIMINLQHPEYRSIYEQKIRELTLIQMVLSNKQRLDITMSIGMSEYPYHGDSVREIIQHADQAMYHIKKNRKCGIAQYSKKFSVIS